METTESVYVSFKTALVDHFVLHCVMLLFWSSVSETTSLKKQRPTTKMWIFRGKKRFWGDSEEEHSIKKGSAFSFLILLWLQDVNNCFALFLTSLKVTYENFPVTSDPQYDAPLAPLHPQGVVRCTFSPWICKQLKILKTRWSTASLQKNPFSVDGRTKSFLGDITPVPLTSLQLPGHQSIGPGPNSTTALVPHTWTCVCVKCKNTIQVLLRACQTNKLAK